MNTPPITVGRWRAHALTLLAFVAVAGVGAAQILIDDGIAVWTIALPLVTLLAWVTSLRRAALVVALGVASWLPVAAILDPERLRVPLWYLNLGLRGGVMLLAISLAAGWRRTLVRHEEMRRVDPATGLVNAREFFRSVDAELQRALRYEHPFTVVYVCLDAFAQVEQRQGRAAGSDLLQGAARVVTAATRGSDTVAWVRGGELGVLMPETGPTAARTVLTRMHDALDAELRRRGVPPSTSFGAVTWIRTEISVDQLLQRTYQMLYAAQQPGAATRIRHEVLDTADVVL